MARRPRAKGRRAALAVAVTALVGGLSGCSVGSEEVLLVGHDENGTAVVGAVNCGFDDRFPAAVVTVRSAEGPREGQEVWAVQRPGRGRPAPEIGPPAPPAPQPRFVGGIELVAVGDPAPPGGDAAIALAEDLPHDLVVEARVFSDDPAPFTEARLARSGPVGTYEVRTGHDEVARGLDAAEAAARIDAECATDDWGFDGGVLLVVAGIGIGALLLLAVPITVVTVRQFRRAGVAAARRRAGEPPVP